MFASVWKFLVQRWQHPGDPSGGAVDGPAAPKPQRRRSESHSIRVSAPRTQRASAPITDRKSSPRELRVAAQHQEWIARVVAAKSTALLSPDGGSHGAPRLARPTSRRAAPPRRTPPARHVWLETRAPATPGNAAAVIALPTRPRHGSAERIASAA
jgi:hypothetical protein